MKGIILAGGSETGMCLYERNQSSYCQSMINR